MPSTDVKEGATLATNSSDGNVEELRRLVETGADVNAHMRDGATPLHLAAQQGHVEAVEMLVEQGADVNVQDLQGKTPAMWTTNRLIKKCLKKSWKKRQPLNVASRWDLIRLVLHNLVTS